MKESAGPLRHQIGISAASADDGDIAHNGRRAARPERCGRIMESFGESNNVGFTGLVGSRDSVIKAIVRTRFTSEFCCANIGGKDNNRKIS